jgi:hypothetical protein
MAQPAQFVLHSLVRKTLSQRVIPTCVIACAMPGFWAGWIILAASQKVDVLVSRSDVESEISSSGWSRNQRCDEGRSEMLLLGTSSRQLLRKAQPAI